MLVLAGGLGSLVFCKSNCFIGKQILIIVVHLVYYLMVLVLMLLNILIIYKIRKRGHTLSETVIEKRRRKDNRRTAMLLVLISSSFIVSYIISLFSVYYRGVQQQIILNVSSHIIWIDAFVNAASYLLLKTKFLSRLNHFRDIIADLIFLFLPIFNNTLCGLVVDRR